MRFEHKYPLNYQQEWAHLFKPDYAYLDVRLSIRELKNVFVNHYGLVIKNGLLVKGCAPNIGHTKYDDDNFYYRHWRKGIEQLLVCKYGKSLPSIKLDDNKKYLLIHSPWFSYYFWLTECLPRLLMVKEQLKDVVLIYPEGWKNINYVNDTLDLFPELEKIIIPADNHLLVKNLIMPEVKPWTPMLIPEHVLDVRNFLFEHTKSTSKENLNIYISREDAKYKKVINESEFEGTINKYGFQKVIMSDKSLFAQIDLMRNTNNLIAITGASLANLLFIKEGATLFDLTNNMYLYDRKYKFHFKKILDILNGNYVVEFCKPIINKSLPDIAMYDIEVDLKVIENDLKKYLTN